MRRSRNWWSVVLATCVVVVAGCTGSDDEVRTAGPEGAAASEGSGGWVRHTLGSFAADREVIGAPAGEGVAVLVVEEPGTVRAWMLHPDGSATESEVEAATSDFRILTAVVDGPGGLVATGDDWQPTFTNFVLSSVDGGASWTERPMTGLEAPMDVAGLVSTGDGYVAVGALRSIEDPSIGPFEPVIVTSPDGVSWTRSGFPTYAEGQVGSVVVVGDRLLAAGRVGEYLTPQMWQSDDGGTNWSEATGAPSAVDVVASGSTVLASSAESGDREEEDAAVIHRSDDGGQSWTGGDPDLVDGFGYLSLFGDRDGFALATNRAVRDPFTELELCYADIEQCSARTGLEDQAVLLSDDATEWRRMDPNSLSGLFRPNAVVHDRAGNTVVLGDADEGEWGAWFWDADQGDVPILDQSSASEGPVYDGPPIVEYGAILEEGERRAFPLYIHCGMDRLGEFNGVQWGRIATPEGETPETGAGDRVPGGWPVVAQNILGFVTLVGSDRIEYSIDDDMVIAVYEPLPADTQLYGCD